MNRRPAHGPPPAQAGLGSLPACDVFYLRTELHRGGFRWVIVQSGLPEPVLVGDALFPTERAARIAGRVGLDRFFTQQNSWHATRLRNDAVPLDG